MNQSHLTQVERYGGVEGYRAEMRRRRALNTTKTGFVTMSVEKRRQAQLNSVKARKINEANRKLKEENAAQENEQSQTDSQEA